MYTKHVETRPPWGGFYRNYTNRRKTLYSTYSGAGVRKYVQIPAPGRNILYSVPAPCISIRMWKDLRRVPLEYVPKPLFIIGNVVLHGDGETRWESPPLEHGYVGQVCPRV